MKDLHLFYGCICCCAKLLYGISTIIAKESANGLSGQTQASRVEPPILPREAVQWTWSLTIGQSGSSDAEVLRERQKEIQGYIDGIKDELGKTGKASQQDIRYIDGVYAAINSCVRTLHIIIRGRDTNFKEVDKLKEVYLAKAEDIVTFSGNLQSAFGRIATMTIGGTSVTAIVAYYFPNLPVFVFPLVLAAAGAISFGIHEQFVKPWKIGENVKANVKNDYQRNQYYQQYVRRSKGALTGLFKETLDLFEEIYGKSYNPVYNKPGKKEEFVNNLLKPIEFENYTCPIIHECFAKGIILDKKNLDRWPTCESGEGYGTCPKRKNA
jgi:hypothetical protein